MVEGRIESEWIDTETEKKFRRRTKFTLAPEQSIRK